MLSSNADIPPPTVLHHPRDLAPTAGLALSLSAAFLGFYAHTGFVSGLWQAGVRPSVMAGSSAGAVTVSLFGLGWTPTQVLDYLLEPEFRRCFLEWKHLLMTPIKRLTGVPHNGLISGKKAVAYFRRTLGDRQIEELPCPTAIAVTNLTRHCGEIRTQGPLAETMVASCAYPFLIEQQIINGERLWDGGVCHESPVAHWIGNKDVTTIARHYVSSRAGSSAQEKVGGLRSAIGGLYQTLCREFDEPRQRQLAAVGQSLHSFSTPAAQHRLWMSRAAALEDYAIGVQAGLAAARAISEHLSSAEKMLSDFDKPPTPPMIKMATEEKSGFRELSPV
jgi:predicted acylesterase/phospholipase RssA